MASSRKREEFWARCANAHSAELLPGDRIAVGCSTREMGGNRLAVFDAPVPERELFSAELNSGHGAAWDAQRGILWALGVRELRAYSLTDWDSANPALRLDATYTLPESGGRIRRTGGRIRSGLFIPSGLYVWRTSGYTTCAGCGKRLTRAAQTNSRQPFFGGGG